MRSPFVTCRRRDSRDAGEDGVRFLPTHAGGALGDGGAVRVSVSMTARSMAVNYRRLPRKESSGTTDEH